MTPQPPPGPPAGALGVFVAELKRRRVLRAAGVYLVVAWGVIQVAATTFGPLGLPQRWVSYVVVLAMLGFPVAMVLAWLFSFSLGRFVLERSPDLPLTKTQVRLSIGVAALVGVSAIAFTGFLSLRFTPNAARAEVQATSPTTVAVLPFEPLSDGPRYQRIADSFTQALTEALSAVTDLRVISADRVLAAKDSMLTMPQVSERLGAGTIVRGVVLGEGDSLRVVVELIDPASGVTLGTSTQDGNAEDALTMLDALVPTAAGFVRSSIGRTMQLAQWEAGTRSREAWSLVQRADALEQRSHELQESGGAGAAMADLEQADTLLARAEQLDDDYIGAKLLRARVAYGLAYIRLNPARPDPQGAAAALEAGVQHATRALAVDPRNAEAFEQRALLRQLRADLLPGIAPEEVQVLRALVERDLRAAIAIEPHRARSLASLAFLLDGRGEFAEARSYLHAAYESNAYLEQASGMLATLFTYAFELGDDEDAAVHCDELKRRYPRAPSAAFCELMLQGWAPAHDPRVRDAWNALPHALAGTPTPRRDAVRAQLEVLVAGVLVRAGMTDSARAVLRRATAQEGDAELLQLEAGVRVQLGEYDVALKLLERYAALVGGPQPLLASSRRFARMPRNPLRPPPAR